LNRKSQWNCRGNNLRGKGRVKVARGHSSKANEPEVYSSQISKKENHVGKYKGFERGKGKYAISCYRCGVEGHKASKFPKMHLLRRRNEVEIHVI